MHFLTLDYSPKILHIAIDEMASTVEGELVNRCLIFNPQKVYARINTGAERVFQDYFSIRPGRRYRLVNILTEMGPGELAHCLERNFGAYCGEYIGGIIAPFTVPSANLEALWTDLVESPSRYLVSREKAA